MASALDRLNREESGIALVITVLLLLLVSAIGISAMNRAGDERTISSASRRQLANLSVAEAGMDLVTAQLRAAAEKGIPVIQISFSEPTLFKDPVSGLYTRVRSGTIDASGTKVIEPYGESNPGQSGDGDEISLGKNQASGRRTIYRVDITASDPSGGNTQVQAQFSVLSHGGSGY